MLACPRVVASVAMSPWFFVLSIRPWAPAIARIGARYALTVAGPVTTDAGQADPIITQLIVDERRSVRLIVVAVRTRCRRPAT